MLRMLLSRCDLTYLDISGNCRTNLCESLQAHAALSCACSGLTSVVHLGLDRVQLYNESSSLLSRMHTLPDLASLSICCCDVPDLENASIILKELTALSALQKLDMRGIAWCCGACEELTAHFSGLQEFQVDVRSDSGSRSVSEPDDDDWYGHDEWDEAVDSSDDDRWQEYGGGLYY